MTEFCYKPSTINHKLILVGTNHKYSSIELRERLSFSRRRAIDTLSLFKKRGVLRGAVILSTCNRVEIYAGVEDIVIGLKELENFIPGYHYIYKGKEALRHLFSVSCGLDSLIIGETQILGQVKTALSLAEGAGFVDEFLGKIFNFSISFAKRIHAETRLSEGKVSIGSVAVDFIKERAGAFSDKKILIIGVGKVTGLVLKYLERVGPNVVLVSNRTFQKAEDLASQIGAEAVRFDNLKQFLRKADIVITATKSPHFIIRKGHFEQRELTGQRRIILDLAVPRDVDPEVKEIKDVDLFTLEDLDSVIKENRERKADEARKIEGFIDIEVENIWRELTRLEPVPALLP